MGRNERMMDAKEAMNRSRSYNEIVYCDDTQENRDILLAECDGNVEANGVSEYWTDDPDRNDGMIWRVHIIEND